MHESHKVMLWLEGRTEPPKTLPSWEAAKGPPQPVELYPPDDKPGQDSPELPVAARHATLPSGRGHVRIAWRGTKPRASESRR